MYDEFVLDYKCSESTCGNLAVFALFQKTHSNHHIADVCNACMQAEGNLQGFSVSVASKRIERGIGEHWDMAEQMGWVNPIDTLFDKYGVDNPEDLPAHEQSGYESAVDEAEADAVEYIDKHFSDYVTEKVTVRYKEKAHGLERAETFKFFSDQEVAAFRLGLANAIRWEYYDALDPEGEVE